MAIPAPWLWIFSALVGAVIGSFLNVCVHRWPLGQSVIRPRPRCAVCSASVAAFDNVPIVSYLLLRGRCRTCGVRISPQYPIVEAATALIWLAAAVRFGISVEALHSAAFLTLLLGIALTDARHMLIPDQFTLVGAGIGLLLAALPGGPAFLMAALGAMVGYGLLWAVKLLAEAALKKEALGIGDIHMMLMVGAFLGTGGVLLTIFLGSVFGVLIAVPALLLRGELRWLQTRLPLGVFLAIGAAIAHGWGDLIWAWYLDYLR
jgi:leader peptidase (prepilin peptidase) / N-methyltransferase